MKHQHYLLVHGIVDARAVHNTGCACVHAAAHVYTCSYHSVCMWLPLCLHAAAPLVCMHLPPVCMHLPSVCMQLLVCLHIAATVCACGYHSVSMQLPLLCACICPLAACSSLCARMQLPLCLHAAARVYAYSCPFVCMQLPSGVRSIQLPLCLYAAAPASTLE